MDTKYYDDVVFVGGTPDTRSPEDELSGHLSIKRSTMYSMVGSGEIPHYRIGRLIRFKRDDMGRWMEKHRKEAVDMDKKARTILKPINRLRMDIDRIVVEKSIAQLKRLKYNPSSGNQVESSTREGGDHRII
jgi:excisionase family DNA binding protein